MTQQEKYNQLEASLRSLYPQGRDYYALLPRGAALDNEFDKRLIRCMPSYQFVRRLASYQQQNAGSGYVYLVRSGGKEYVLKALLMKSEKDVQDAIKELEIAETQNKRGLNNVIRVYYQTSLSELEKYLRQMKAHQIREAISLQIMERGLPFDVFIRDLLCKRNGHLTRTEALVLCYELFSRLAVFHSTGFLHRDIKLNNALLIQKNGRTKLVFSDFGTSRTIENGFQPATGCEAGFTAYYVAPERLNYHGRANVSSVALQKADVYSMAVTMYIILNNGAMPPVNYRRVPWLQNPVAVVVPNPPPPRNSPDHQLSNLLLRCLSYNVNARPTAEEMTRELDRMLFGHQSHQQNRQPVRQQNRPPVRPQNKPHRNQSEQEILDQLLGNYRGQQRYKKPHRYY